MRGTNKRSFHKREFFELKAPAHAVMSVRWSETAQGTNFYVTLMTIHRTTDNGIIWKLDADDKKRYNTDCDFTMGNRHYSIYGDNPRAMETEMERIMNTKTTIIY